MLWDDLEPDRLSLDQRQALIDWLHWGGQLIVSGPGVPTGRRVTPVVAQGDLGRTLLDLAGFGDAAFPGGNLLRHLEHAGDDPGEPLFALHATALAASLGLDPASKSRMNGSSKLSIKGMESTPEGSIDAGLAAAPSIRSSRRRTSAIRPRSIRTPAARQSVT